MPTEGERWTAEALRALRRARYRPAGWLHFIQSSFERSAETRARNPNLTRQARRWGLIGAASWLGLCRASRSEPSFTPHPAGGLLWWVTCSAMLELHLGMAENEVGHRRDRLSLADMVTMVRFWTVPALPAVSPAPNALALMIAAGGATDWLDGVLARNRGQTRLGRDLDSTADVAFLATAAFAVHQTGRLPSPAGELLAMRYVLGLSLAFVVQFARGRRPSLEARRLGGLLRVSGLVLAAAGSSRSGQGALLVGSIMPPHRPAAVTRLA